MDNKIIASNNDIVFYKKNNGDTNIELLIKIWILAIISCNSFVLKKENVTEL